MLHQKYGRLFCAAAVLFVLCIVCREGQTEGNKMSANQGEHPGQATNALQGMRILIGDSEATTKERYPSLFVLKLWEKDGEQSYGQPFPQPEAIIRGVMLACKDGKVSYWSASGPGDETASNTEKFMVSLVSHLLWILEQNGKPSQVYIGKATETSESDEVVLIWDGKQNKVEFNFTAPWSISSSSGYPERHYRLVAYSDQSFLRKGAATSATLLKLTDKAKQNKALRFLDAVEKGILVQREGVLVPRNVVAPFKIE